ncbi:4Fe-4S dicluster domain-containing protein [Desulfosarcina widdelii]|nr:4Fe-4S dicluster domain-containing protein [Desulfosarcina widdelii]
MSGSIKEKMEAILTASGARGCIECGKCVAVCPMGEMYPNFGWEMSPRGIIRRAVTQDDLYQEPVIWCCTGCNAGTEVCPEGVSCRDLIRGLRCLAIEMGIQQQTRNCTICGAPFVSGPVVAFVRERLGHHTRDYMDTCHLCRQRQYAQRNA